ncbi:ion transporter [Opitutales bacterium]|nr:ion transporter [Opitutales bacterium]
MKKNVEIFIQILIVLSLVCFTIETIPSLSSETYKILNTLEIVFVAIFTLEYVARIYFSKQKIKFIFSFFALIDMIAIIPFYLSLGFDLKSLRAVRLIRVFRLLKLTRYNKAVNFLSNAFKDSKEELLVFSFLASALLYLTSVGIYYFEKDLQPEEFGSVPQALWWSVVTLTSVGYGDVTPVSTAGKIFTSIILFLGIGLISVPSAILVSAYSKASKK